MKTLEVACLASFALVVAVVACTDTLAPASRPVLVPAPRISKVVNGPPDLTFSIPADRGWPPTQFHIAQFPYDTWVTLESPGTVVINAKPKLSSYTGAYVDSGTAAGANGVSAVNVCALNFTVQDGYGTLPNFGNCGSPLKVDTILSKGLQTPWIVRGPLPSDDINECSTTSSVCHWLNQGDFSTVRERPIPVSLNKLKASKHTSTFVTPETIRFTATKTLDNIFVQGAWNQVTMAITLWQWIGADSTRNPTPPWTSPCHSAQLTACDYTAYESGRMIVKAFVGGWEQTNSVTVQCLTSPLDSILNDSTNDFQVRSALRQMLDSSHPEVAPGFGYDPVKGRGLMHEIAGNIWKLPDGGGYMLVPGDSDKNTECVSYVDSAAPPPVPRATLVGRAHTHPSPWNGPVYGCPTKYLNNGRDSIPFSKFPGDTANGKRPFMKNRKDMVKGASTLDWLSFIFDLPPKQDYVIDSDGTAAEMSYYTMANGGRIHNWAPSTAGKCTWVK
jgi:hypothetical protein